MKIGVFDSGVGGASMSRAIARELPQLEIELRSDKQHFPYGNRSLAEIYSFTKPILEALVNDGCQVIVVACNTVTTNFIAQLRAELPVLLIGMEPMIKPAAARTKTGIIAVCATPRTLDSARYGWLKNEYARDIKVLEPDCSDWASMIETNNLNRSKIDQIIDDVCVAGADVVVLGCTHYHWIEEQIKQIAEGRAEVLQPEVPVINQLKKVLAQLS